MSGLTRQFLAGAAVFVPGVALVETVGFPAGVVWVLLLLFATLVSSLRGRYVVQ